MHSRRHSEFLTPEPGDAVRREGVRIRQLAAQHTCIRLRPDDQATDADRPGHAADLNCIQAVEQVQPKDHRRTGARTPRMVRAFLDFPGACAWARAQND